MTELFSALDELGNQFWKGLRFTLASRGIISASVLTKVIQFCVHSITHRLWTQVRHQSRLTAHEDINVITLLIGSREPGLEVMSKSGAWIPVTILEGAIICNVGDNAAAFDQWGGPVAVNHPPRGVTRRRHTMKCRVTRFRFSCTLTQTS